MIHPGRKAAALIICGKEPVGQKELVEMLDIQFPSSLSELLKSLRQGARKPYALTRQDKRNMIVTLTGEERRRRKRRWKGRTAGKNFPKRYSEERTYSWARYLTEAVRRVAKRADAMLRARNRRCRPHPGPHWPRMARPGNARIPQASRWLLQDGTFYAGSQKMR